MPSWQNNIERWRQFANWEAKDIPVDLVLAIINNESGGQAGIKSTAHTKSAEILTDDGSLITVLNAMGLMQVIPPNVAAWNKHKDRKITYEDMTGDDERAVRLQIRIGSSIFANCVYQLHKYDPVEFPGKSPGGATPEQIQLALICYAIGAGKKGGERGLIPRLERLREMRKPLTLTSLKEAFPKWGYSEKRQRWINRPLHAASKVWSNYIDHAEPSVMTGGKSSPIGQRPKTGMDGHLLGVVFFLAAAYVSRKEIAKLFGR